MTNLAACNDKAGRQISTVARQEHRLEVARHRLRNALAILVKHVINRESHVRALLLRVQLEAFEGFHLVKEHERFFVVKVDKQMSQFIKSRLVLLE